MESRNELIRFLKSLLLGSIIALSIVLSLLLLYISIFQDSIKEQLVSGLNEVIQGKISIGKIEYSLFSDFPNISFSIQNVKLHQNTLAHETEHSKAAVHLENIVFSLASFNLLKGELIVERVKLDQGEARLMVDHSGNLNLLELLKSQSDSENRSAEMKAGTSVFRFDLKEIAIKDLEINYEDQVANYSSKFQLLNVTTGLQYDSGILRINPEIDLCLSDFYYNDRTFTLNDTVQVRGTCSFDGNSNVLNLGGVELTWEEIGFRVSGELRTDDFKVGLTFGFINEDLSVLSSFIEEDILYYNKSSIEEGKISLNGKIKGKLIGSIPEFSGKVRVQDLVLQIPDEDVAIKVNSIAGGFSGGKSDDELLDLSLQIDTIDMQLDEGYVNGHFYLHGLDQPKIEMDLAADLDLYKLHRILKMDQLASLRGSVRIDGNWDSEISTEKNQLFLEIEDVSIDHRSLQSPITDLNSIVSFNERGAVIDIRQLKSSSNDLNGKIHIEGYPISYEKSKDPFAVHVNLKSNYLDLNSIIINKALVKDELSLQENMIIDLSLNADIKQNTTKDIPESIEWILHHYSSKINETIAVTNVFSKGSISVTDSTFRLKSPVSYLQTNLGYLKFSNILLDESNNEERKLEGNVEAERIKLDSLIFAVDEDVNFNLNNNSLTADVTFEISTDTKSKEGRGILKGNLKYEDPDLDTVFINDLNLELNHISFAKDTSDFSKVSHLQGSLELASIQTSFYDEENLMINTIWYDSLLEFNLRSDENYKAGSDQLTLRISLPWEEPVIDVQYEINKLNLTEFWSSESDDKIMSGNLSVVSKLTTKGKTMNRILQNLNGELDIYSNGIAIYGFDLDQLLESYDKSQKFQLSDLGAYFLVGPLGALVTKGFDFVEVANIDAMDSTVVSELTATWSLNSGILKSEDVALVTARNLVALNGQLDIHRAYLDTITVAVVDDKGCIIIDQSAWGPFDSLEYSDFKVGKKLFGAFVNVYKAIADEQCVPFYQGALIHPNNKKNLN